MLGASCFSGCERPERALPSPDGAPAQSRAPASGSASASAAPRGSGVPALIPREIAIRLVTEPGTEPDSWHVVAKSPALSLNVRLAEFKLPYLCGVAPWKPLAGPRGPVGPLRVLVVCPTTRWAEIFLAADNDRLSVDGKEQTLPPGVQVVLPTTIEQPKAPTCDNEQDAPPFVVRMKRRLGNAHKDEPAEFTFELALADRISELFRIPRKPMTCSTSRVFPKSESMRISCAGLEMDSVIIDIEAKERTLFIDWHKQGIHAREHRRRFGFRLPCGALLRLQPLEFRDPMWKPGFGHPCGHQCRSRDAGCQDACYDAWADDYGELSPRGIACIERCDAQNLKCISYCQSIGKYP